LVKWQVSAVHWGAVSGHDKWVPATTPWRVLTLRMEKRPPDKEGSCEYTEKIVADSRQGVVLQLGSWGRC